MGRKFVRFELTDTRADGTSVFNIYNNITGEHLGMIDWYDNWRKYCFLPNDNTLWEVECLKEVIDYIKELMKYIKDSRRKTL